MAVKDHSLDPKITESAKAEFLEYGFEKASLHKIADRAGISTGALYTRYKSKDDLFCSLVSDALKQIGSEFEPIKNMYYEAKDGISAEKLIKAIQTEEKIYLDLLFDYYDECVLFFCKSDGSSIELMLKRLMEDKARETVEYFKSIAKHEINFDGIEFILSEQFRYYRMILEKGYSKEKALSCMKTVEAFMEAGWRSLFEKLL